ncbi:hypothetical protein ACIGXM_15005 [Kitasatospora sp. NPDC052896]|uniref:hypothetical protein n=1 Tax=Kitasatospora sp. NPDC052896 TaxID=3364061 RepID=UPI0037CA2A5D
MAHTDVALRKAMLLFEGAIGMALVDAGNGTTLGTLGGSEEFDLTIAAAGNSELLRAKMRTMRMLGLAGTIEDILITTTSYYQLICPLKSSSSNDLFLYLALDRKSANLALARHQLHLIEGQLNSGWGIRP